VRVGALGSLGFPRPLAIEGLVKIERRLVLGVEYSFLPPMTFSDVRATLWALAGDARFFPFGGGPFFLGARAGRQHLGLSTTVQVPSYGAASGSAEVDTWFVNPRLGLLWTWKPGLTLGIDAGVQIPLSSSQSSTLPPGVSPPAGVASAADTLGRGVLPTIDLLEAGILF
jgi:hypothetical protein